MVQVPIVNDSPLLHCLYKQHIVSLPPQEEIQQLKQKLEKVEKERNELRLNSDRLESRVTAGRLWSELFTSPHLTSVITFAAHYIWPPSILNNKHQMLVHMVTE